MNIKARVERVERQLGLEQNTRPFILVLRAGPAPDEAAYQARLKERIADVIRRHPNDRFRLLL